MKVGLAKRVLGKGCCSTSSQKQVNGLNVGYGLWESEEAMVTAKPDMIALLDTARDLLEEISPELGVTDPVSGTVVFELDNS